MASEEVAAADFWIDLKFFYKKRAADFDDHFGLGLGQVFYKVKTLEWNGKNKRTCRFLVMPHCFIIITYSSKSLNVQ